MKFDSGKLHIGIWSLIIQDFAFHSCINFPMQVPLLAQVNLDLLRRRTSQLDSVLWSNIWSFGIHKEKIYRPLSQHPCHHGFHIRGQTKKTSQPVSGQSNETDQT